MKRILTYFSIFTISIMSTISCTDSSNPEPKDNPQDTLEIPIAEDINLKECTERIVSSDNEFGIDMFKRIIAEDTENANIFISPTSISLCLGMIYNGADGDTKTAMETALKKDGLSVAAINQTYKSLIDSLVNCDERVLLTIANSIFYKQDFEVKQAFIDSNRVNYNARVSSLDFANPSSVDTINIWAADNTNDKITHIIDAIPAEAIMYLMNAIYFKGIWKYEFDPASTTNNTFTLPTGSTIQVPTMHRAENFGYYENTDLQMVQLPYGNGDYNMYVVLPSMNSNITDLVSNLSPENWNTWTSGVTVQQVDVYLPKFKFEFEKVLNEYLSDMGMGIAFTAGLANFSKIADADLFLSFVKHKTFVEVNEEGTEAAAVTIGGIYTTSVPMTKYFTVNRPFVFAIQEKNTNSIVFIGRVMNPLKEE